MGGRVVAESLRSASIGSGHVVVFSGTSAIAWTQAFVGCLRVGATMVSGLPSGFRSAKAAIDDDLRMRELVATPGGSVCVHRSIAHSSITALAVPSNVGPPDASLAVQFVLAPSSAFERKRFARAMIRGLVDAAEIHVLYERSASPTGT